MWNHSFWSAITPPNLNHCSSRGMQTKDETATDQINQLDAVFILAYFHTFSIMSNQGSSYQISQPTTHRFKEKQSNSECVCDLPHFPTIQHSLRTSIQPYLRALVSLALLIQFGIEFAHFTHNGGAIRDIPAAASQSTTTYSLSDILPYSRISCNFCSFSFSFFFFLLAHIMACHSNVD